MALDCCLFEGCFDEDIEVADCGTCCESETNSNDLPTGNCYCESDLQLFVSKNFEQGSLVSSKIQSHSQNNFISSLDVQLNKYPSSCIKEYKNSPNDLNILNCTFLI